MGGFVILDRGPALEVDTTWSETGPRTGRGYLEEGLVLYLVFMYYFEFSTLLLKSKMTESNSTKAEKIQAG